MSARVVTVLGVGRAAVTPDVALLVLGVRTQGAGPAEALDACSGRARAVIDAVSRLVSEPGALQSGHLTVQPDWDHGPGGRRLLGYVAQTTIRVRVRHLDDAGRIASAALDAAGDAGLVHSLGLSVDAPEAAEAAARDHAFRDAQARAEQYARLASLTLGGLADLSEVPRGGGMDAGLPRKMSKATAAANIPVEAGELEVTAQVFVTWELVD